MEEHIEMDGHLPPADPPSTQCNVHFHDGNRCPHPMVGGEGLDTDLCEAHRQQMADQRAAEARGEEWWKA